MEGRVDDSRLGVELQFSVVEAINHLALNVQNRQWVQVTTGGDLVTVMHFYIPTVRYKEHHLLLKGMHSPENEDMPALLDFHCPNLAKVRVWNLDDLIWTYHFTWPMSDAAGMVRGIQFMVQGSR